LLNDFDLSQNLGVDFGRKSPLKKVVNICAYTGEKLVKKARTIEHIKPRSAGGHSNASNYLITGEAANQARGNMRFDRWIKKHPEGAQNIQNYLNKFRGIQVKGEDYVEEVKNTLNREARGVVTFAGNKKLDIKA